MKVNKDNEDWIGQVRNSLNSYEPTPPADGWSRLEKELALVEASRASLIPIWVKRSLSVAAIFVCVLTAGALLWSDALVPSAPRDIEMVATLPAELVAPVAETFVVSDMERAILDEMNEVAGDATFSNTKIVASLGGRSASQVSARVVDIQLPEVSSTVDSDDELDVSSGESAEPLEDIVEPQLSQSNIGSEAKESAKAEVKSQATRSVLAYDWESPTPPTKRANRGGVSLFTGGAASQSSGELHRTLYSAMINDDGFVNVNKAYVDLDYLYDTYAYNHSQPLSFGATFRKELPYGLSLETGLVYTYLKSEVTMVIDTPSVDQKLHFLGVPLRLDWTFLKKSNFTMYLGGGGMAEKCLSASLGTDNISEKSIQLSMFGAIGAQYNLGDHVGLYFEPKISHYFTDTNLRTIRTDNDVDLTLQLGVRFRY